MLDRDVSLHPVLQTSSVSDIESKLSHVVWDEDTATEHIATNEQCYRCVVM